MNGLLSVLWSWVAPEPLPDITTIEAEFVGGPHDGGLCEYQCWGELRVDDVRTIEGRRYRLAVRRGKAFWDLVIGEYVGK